MIPEMMSTAEVVGAAGFLVNLTWSVLYLCVKVLKYKYEPPPPQQIVYRSSPEMKADLERLVAEQTNKKIRGEIIDLYDNGVIGQPTRVRSFGPYK
jgi:hypothetical protein